MNVHKNARLTPRGREWMVELAASGQTPKAIAEAVGICPRTARKWLQRYESEGLDGLNDRSSRPHRLHRPTPQPVVKRSASAPAVDRQSDRDRGWRLAGHGEPNTAAAGPEPAKRAAS